MKKAGIYLMGVLYILAGINHFIHPEFYLKIIPHYIPFHHFVNYFSGACEIIFGALLFPEKSRHLAAWLIILLLIAIFPANIQMTIDYLRENNPKAWITIVRLPLQVVLIWWAWMVRRD